jgi:hypothetical protein
MGNLKMRPGGICHVEKVVQATLSSPAPPKGGLPHREIRDEIRKILKLAGYDPRICSWGKLWES